MMKDFFKNISNWFKNLAEVETQDNFLDHVMQVIWTIGLVVPTFILTLNQTHSEFLKYVLVAMSLNGGFSLYFYKFHKFSTKKLGIITALVLNIGLSSIIIESPLFFNTTAYWYPVALTLTIFISGLRTGLLTLIMFEIVLTYHQITKSHLGLSTPTNWAEENWANAVYIDKAVSLITFYLFIYFLILSRKKIYQSLLKAKESVFKSSKLSEVGKVAANIAHEINNPITIISASNYMIAKELKKEDPNLEVIKKNVESIDKVCERMTIIVNGMKKMSRDGSGDPFEEIVLCDLLQETEAFFNHKFKNENISLKIQLDDKNIRISGRFAQLSQILINLINNAADAIEEEPVKWIKIKVSQTYDSIRIMIIDSGKGIPKELEDKVFEPLFTTKPAEKGTGLGLSIVNTIVQEHGGNLIIDRNYNDSRLTITLPKRVAKAA